MRSLAAKDFRQFFLELHGKTPFPWQEELAERVCSRDWPEVIDLPTASGKTACIDIALFALAARGSQAHRRIFFVVDRRVVVNEAYLRMCEIRKRLKNADSGVVGAVAERLRNLAGPDETGGDEPLHVYEMRGGAFRDENWVRNPLQPTVVASTVDQVGSRLLFRGYGVSENSWPLHAGLIGNDALIILDEAHCSRAFAQTLARVKEYRSAAWASEPLQTPFRFVEMTATPSSQTGDRHTITERDRNDHTLRQRLKASKPTRLVDVKGKKDDFAKLANELISQATRLAEEAKAKRIAIFVNRVRTAKIVRERLPGSELVVGRMRAIDRDDLYRERLANLKSGNQRKDDDPLTFVVSTQCLEVGADLDFDVVVSECASIDALQQRFGRLDRLGEFGRARGAIVCGSWQINPKQPDPVYGESLSKTWEWLKSVGGETSEVNMGIESRDGEPETVAERLNSADSAPLRLIGQDAPILLPAHVDAFAQTKPVPEPDPLLEPFLHGPKRAAPDVQVVWRADLNQANPETWPDIVALCPPSSREAMPVQIFTFKKWFTGEKNADSTESDLAVGAEEDEPKRPAKIPVLIWRGDETDKPTMSVSAVKPGQTLVLPASASGWDELGYKPECAQIDVADRAAFKVRRSASLRLHPEVIKEWPDTASKQLLENCASKEGQEDEIIAALPLYRAELEALGEERWPYPFLKVWTQDRRNRTSVYPHGPGYLLETPKSKKTLSAVGQVPLDDHSAHVESAVATLAGGLANSLGLALKRAAAFHDYGKVDLRYQAWLRGGDMMAARYAPKPIAKSGEYRLGKQESVGLPKGFRHELLSLIFAERAPEIDGDSRDLILHLIASHHGRCRPFAPVVLDKGAECVSHGGISVRKEEREEDAPHRLNRGVADRYWKLSGQYGWWGLAYLEALLRLADWSASASEGTEAAE